MLSLRFMFHVSWHSKYNGASRETFVCFLPERYGGMEQISCLATIVGNDFCLAKCTLFLPLIPACCAIVEAQTMCSQARFIDRRTVQRSAAVGSCAHLSQPPSYNRVASSILTERMLFATMLLSSLTYPCSRTPPEICASIFLRKHCIAPSTLAGSFSRDVREHTFRRSARTGACPLMVGSPLISTL